VVKIAYTAIPENLTGNSHFLKKPIRFRELNKLIENLKCPLEPQSDKNFPAEIIDQKRSISSTILETVFNNNQDQFIRLRTDTETVIIDSNRLLFSGKISDKEVEILLVNDFSSCEINILEDNPDPHILSRDLSGPLSRAISQRLNKKLFSTLNYQDYFKLIRWPNFKKIRYNSAYVQIAVLLNKKFYDIASVSQICKVSYEDVITFINICYALHNLEIQTNVKPDIVKNPVKESSALLAKIRSRLGI
jgi:hypothetical protein